MYTSAKILLYYICIIKISRLFGLGNTSRFKIDLVASGLYKFKHHMESNKKIRCEKQSSAVPKELVPTLKLRLDQSYLLYAGGSYQDCQPAEVQVL